MEGVVAAHQGGHDLGFLAELHLERPTGTDCAVPHLEGVIGLVLPTDAGKELVDVVNDPHHQNTFPVSTLPPTCWVPQNW